MRSTLYSIRTVNTFDMGMNGHDHHHSRLFYEFALRIDIRVNIFTFDMNVHWQLIQRSLNPIWFKWGHQISEARILDPAALNLDSAGSCNTWVKFLWLWKNSKPFLELDFDMDWSHTQHLWCQFCQTIVQDNTAATFHCSRHWWVKTS